MKWTGFAQILPLDRPLSCSSLDGVKTSAIVEKIYVHRKGTRYKVLVIARNATNGPSDGREVVVYQDLDTDGQIYCRDRAEFEDGRFTVWEG